MLHDCLPRIRAVKCGTAGERSPDSHRRGKSILEGDKDEEEPPGEGQDNDQD